MYLAKVFDSLQSRSITCIYDDEDIEDMPGYGETIEMDGDDEEDLPPLEVTVGEVLYDKSHIIIYEVLDVMEVYYDE